MKIRPATEEDLIELSRWFLSESEAKEWGGPSIHFPFSVDQLNKDIEWDVVDSYAMIDENDNLLGFAQACNKFGCKHLKRIVVSPEMRGKRVGFEFMTTLLNATTLAGVNFSLFVYQDNIPAKKLYDRLGFVAQPYPDGQQEIQDCIFMVRKCSRA
jgi:ribosomal protein S18 acetylase RimI-like enzyme